ncbi:MAG: hypothetical protein JNL70_00405 [Saprospiraceae bacterium]|nr:hypothetical protein [Saprospiraceae bacterium]
MRIIWLFRRLLFALVQTPRRLVRLFTFYHHPFYRSYTPSVKWAAAGLLLADTLFLFDIFEILSNLFSPNSRFLTKIEIDRAEKIFKNALYYALIMVDKRSLPVKRGFAHAYVTFNTVNSWRPIRADVFIHELVHVWQYQQFGAGYIAAALAAQRSPAGYDYTFTEGWHMASFFDLNAEQQAEFVQDFYLQEKGFYTQRFIQRHIVASGVQERFLNEMIQG